MRHPPRPLRFGLSGTIVAAGLSAATPHADAAINLGYFGGPVVSHAVIVPVFWNANVSSSLTVNLPPFYADLVQSNYWDLLAQYSTAGVTPQDGQAGSGQLIGRGSASAGVVLAPTKCPATVLTSCTLTESDIDAEINHQIDLGTLPAPTVDALGHVDTVYMLTFPTNLHVTIGSAPPLATSCVDVCSANRTLIRNATPIGLGIVMDAATPGCDAGCGNGSALQNTTQEASIAVVDAVTDVAVGVPSFVGRPLAWYDASHGQVAESCPGSADTMNVGGRIWTINRVASIPPLSASPTCAATHANLLTIAAPPTPVSLPPGASTAVTISTASAFTASTISFRVNDLPSGIAASFLPASVSPGQSTQLLLSVDPALSPVDLTVDVGGLLSSPVDLALTSFKLSVRLPDPVFADGFE